MMDHSLAASYLEPLPGSLEVLSAMARDVRSRVFGSQAVVRGVIEVTDACRVDCEYCPMRRSNHEKRYLMTTDQIVEAAKPIKDLGIRVVFLQGGEIPKTTSVVGEAIPKIRDYFDNEVEILLCLGNKSRDEYAYLKQQGADSYILKYETSDPLLHRRLRHETLEARLACLQDLRDLGYKVGTGLIVGLPGQTREALVEDIKLTWRLSIQMASCTPFIPAKDTPLAAYPPGDVDFTLLTMALMRLMNPTALIPTVSALEKLRPGGQLQGLQAGANVITVNFTPERERAHYKIYGIDRYIVGLKHALSTLAQAGLSCEGLKTGHAES